MFEFVMTKKTAVPEDDTLAPTEATSLLFNAITPFPTVAGAIFRVAAELERAENHKPVQSPAQKQKTTP